MDTLPNELVDHVISYLDRFDLETVSCISKLYSTLTQWHKKCQNKRLRASDMPYIMMGYCWKCLVKNELSVANDKVLCIKCINSKYYCANTVQHKKNKVKAYCGKLMLGQLNCRCDGVTLHSMVDIHLGRQWHVTCATCNNHTLTYYGQCRMCLGISEGKVKDVGILRNHL